MMGFVFWRNGDTKVLSKVGFLGAGKVSDTDGSVNRKSGRVISPKNGSRRGLGSNPNEALGDGRCAQEASSPSRGSHSGIG